MAFQVSPGVNISEIDQTTSAPAVATTEGAMAGVFRWGPVEERVLVDSEGTLVSKFGKPSANNYETFYTASSFLAYGNKLYVVRAGNTAYTSDNPMKTATANTLAVYATSANGDVDANVFPAAVGSNTDLQLTYVQEQATVKNDSLYADATTSLSNHPGLHYSARYPGQLGNTLKISVCASGAAFQSNVNIDTLGGNTYTFTYANVAQSSTDGSGNSAFFDVVVNSNNTYTVTVADGGEGHANGDTITIVGAEIGGANTTNDVDLVATTDANGVITSVAATGTAVGGAANAEFTIAIGSTQGNIVLDKKMDSDSTAITNITGAFLLGDLVTVGNTSIGSSTLKLTSFGTVTTNATHTILPVNFENKYTQRAAFSTTEVTRRWEYASVVDKAPAATYSMVVANRRDANNVLIADGMHVVVEDEDGLVSGVPGTVLEVFANVSRATDAKTEEGDDNFYKNVIRDRSNYIWAFNQISGADDTTIAAATSSLATLPTSLSFVGGQDGDDENNLAEGTIMSAYDFFRNSEEVDISLLLAGKARGGTYGELVANYLIDNIAESRKDCIVYVSPDKNDVVSGGSSTTENIINFRNALTNSSYGILDSGYKYTYDRYNDVYRWVPLNGDMAGLAVRTDDARDPWFSPAGLQRGAIKNVVKLAFNPDKTARDQLYKADINPVVTIPGQGTVLFGDKTLLGRPSPFDRINVRRLFIVLEKTVATAARFALFEFNDEFTRAQFKNLVEPFLRDVQGRRGIYDFRVVCDETNNTQDIIDANQFVGDIYIKPAKSINFIQLNFVAVRSGVEFSEIVGIE